MDVLTVGTSLIELTPGESGVTLVEARTFKKLATGSATLFGFALVRLGLEAGLISAVGDDEFGEFFVQQLRSYGLDASQVYRVRGQLTSLSLAAADGLGGKSFRFYRFPGYSDPLGTLDSARISEEVLSLARLFDFTESAIRQSGPVRVSVFDLARRSRKLGLQVCYAPNWRPVLWDCDEPHAREIQQQAASVSDLVILNAEEAQVIAGVREMAGAARAIGSLGPKIVAITAGGDRSALIFHDGRLDEVPPFPVEVRYDVGAGDTFHAGYLAAHLGGADPVAAGRFAAATAALKISRPPELGNLPTRTEVNALLGRG